MVRNARQWMFIALVVCLGLAGCSKMEVDILKATPARPAEMDKLDMFAGTQKVEGMLRLRGVETPSHVTGTVTGEWDINKWCLVQHGEYDMGDLGKVQEHAIWTWDLRRRRYVCYWMNDRGGIGQATAWYEAPTRQWHINSTSTSTRRQMWGKDTFTVVDDKTMEWSMTRSVLLGLVETETGSGSITRE